MQIVIDIPDNMDLRNYDIPYDILNIITSGTPLPKGHGRLIDADKLTENILCQTFGLRSVDIENAQTIIEADKESKDANSN